ncbi:MAG: CPBP family intramembrane metalloprotease [Clostridia bacterium]|nr:CPBP family intramembrane metalloprotease [Clostridia bacterium]
MSRRFRHLLAYAASMFSLLIFQLLMFLPGVSKLSDYHADVFYSLISQVVCMGIVPLAVLLFVREKGLSVADTFRYMRYKKPEDVKSTLLVTLGIALLITPFTMAFNALTNLIFVVVGYTRPVSAGAIYGGVGDLFVYFFITAALPAVFEEFTHRGVLLSGLEDRGSEYTAVILSALLFGLMHENPAQMIYATFGGILFALVVLKTGSILPAMVAHFANNAVAVFLDYSEQKATRFGVWYKSLLSASNALSFLLTVVVMVAGVYGIIRILQYLSRKREKPISERKLFGVITVDGYMPNGKATLRDNAFLYATAIAEGAVLLITLIGGIAR